MRLTTLIPFLFVTCALKNRKMKIFIVGQKIKGGSVLPDRQNFLEVGDYMNNRVKERMFNDLLRLFCQIYNSFNESNETLDDPVSRIPYTATEAMAQQIKNENAGIERYQSDPVFHAKVQQTVYAVIQVFEKDVEDTITEAILNLIQEDPHQWSTRPCSTCRTISGLIGRNFGCCLYVERKAQPQEATWKPTN